MCFCFHCSKHASYVYRQKLRFKHIKAECLNAAVFVVTVTLAARVLNGSAKWCTLAVRSTKRAGDSSAKLLIVLLHT